LQPDSKLYEANLRNLQKEPMRLTAKHKEIVRRAILDKAAQLEQKILAMAVCHNHIHLVIAYNGTPIEYSVKHYKSAAIVALRKEGFSGRLWSTGYYKQFCFDEKTLRHQISYVNSHNRKV